MELSGSFTSNNIEFFEASKPFIKSFNNVLFPDPEGPTIQYFLLGSKISSGIKTILFATSTN